MRSWFLAEQAAEKTVQSSREHQMAEEAVKNTGAKHQITFENVAPSAPQEARRKSPFSPIQFSADLDGGFAGSHAGRREFHRVEAGNVDMKNGD